MAYTVKTTAPNMQAVCIVSVQITVAIPPCLVYKYITAMIEATVKAKAQVGVEPLNIESKNAISTTIATKNSLNEAPIVRLSRKNDAPVLYDQSPNLFSR